MCTPVIEYLVTLRAATPEDRKTILRNITRHQRLTIEHVAMGLINGSINPLRRDVKLLERKKGKATSVICSQNQKKKQLVNRHHSVIPTLLKRVYLIQTIVKENRKNGWVKRKLNMSEFYIYLSSRDSSDIRKNNTPSEFWVQFPKSYLLAGQWKCALTETSLTCNFKPRSPRLYLCCDILEQS